MIHSVPSDIYDCPTCRQPLLYAVNEDGEGLDHEMVCSTCCRAYLVDMQTGALESMADALKVARGRADALQSRLDDLLAPVEGVDPAEVLQLDREGTPGPWEWNAAGWLMAHDEMPAVLEHPSHRGLFLTPVATASVYPGEQGQVFTQAADQQMIAYYRTAAPILVREVARLRAQANEHAEWRLRVCMVLGLHPAATSLEAEETLRKMATRFDDLLAALAAEQGKPEGAPSSDWRRKNGVWERDYPNGDSATVFPDGTWFRGRFGGPPARKGQAANQRAAMLSADKATP